MQQMSDMLRARFRRLAAIADLTAPCDTAADIGCDHAYLSILLVQENRAKRAVACDLRPGPLAAAKKNVERAGLSAQIDLRLADGLAELSPGEADAIVIAGMGGPLMQRILSEGEAAAKAARQLVLSPQSDAAAFRRFLWENGYVFLAEDMVCEDGRFYPLMRVRPAEDHEERQPLGEADFAFGPLLRKQPHPVFRAWLLRQEAAQLKIRENLAAREEDERRVKRREEAEEELGRIRRALADLPPETAGGPAE